MNLDGGVMYNPLSLEGKRIMVTGASSGLGRACAEMISRLGGEVLLVARNEERLRETMARLEGSGHRLEVFDLCNVEAIPGWMKTLTAAGKPFDGLVHSAGIQFTTPLKVMKLSEFERLMTINLTSSYFLAKGFRQRGVCNAPASLVFLSSIAGLVGQPALSAYCTSKAALQGMTRSLAMELAREGIRVNCVSPGHVATEMAEGIENTLNPEQLEEIVQLHPLGIGRAEDVAHSIAFLLAETGRWITGSNLVVDGGYTAQ